MTAMKAEHEKQDFVHLKEVSLAFSWDAWRDGPTWALIIIVELRRFESMSEDDAG